MNTEGYLTDEEYIQYRSKILASLDTHINPSLSLSIEALDAEIIEWRGEGCFICDPRGRRYFDGATGGGVFALGHAHPRIVEAVCQQAKLGGLSVRVGCVPKSLELMDKLSEIIPGHYTHGHIGTTGTEAVEAALKLARLTTGRSRFLGMQSGYHGMSIASLSVSGIPAYREGFPPLLHEAQIIPYNDIEAAKAAITDEIAAIILEPIQWGAGCRVAEIEYLQALRRLCDEHGVMLIFDEIQTGMGRTGYWFAADRAQVVPDMIVCGKALSGGMMPISALMYNERVHQAQLPHPLFITSTFAGNPLSCAAAIATIDFMREENLLDHVRELSDISQHELDRLQAKHPDIIASHSGLGLMRGLLTTYPIYGFVMSIILQLEHRVCMPCMAFDQRMLRFSPPFIASTDEIRQVFDAIDKTCQRLHQMGISGVQQYMQEMATKVAQVAQKRQTSPTQA